MSTDNGAEAHVRTKSLIEVAHSLVNPRGKGIYATDEDPSEIQARLIAALGEAGKNISWTEAQAVERRKRWRECLYETMPTEYISGVILYPETLHDFKLAPVLANRGIVPGVRANGEEYPIPASPLEPATDGLDNLLPRMTKAFDDGARFAKFRTGFMCTSLATGGLATQLAIDTQSETLARFASIAQRAGLVPIVEPDVDFSGDADLSRSAEVHEKVISAIFARCVAHGVLIEGALIKPSFPQPGLKHPSRQSTSAVDIGLATVKALSHALPVALPGVLFLSGGLSDENSTAYLAAVNQLVDQNQDGIHGRLPPLTFSFGRGLQGDAMSKWVSGDEDGARHAFKARAKACSLAVRGKVE
ncbi:hypothetical protein PTI98_011305 [Pleurotus ostreatus]|nr:hypothetical protein PTI98_011305 [Pleurotus ostreatus]